MAMRIHSLPCNIQIFTATIASLSILVFISFISSVHGRILRINSSDDLISDGIDHVQDQSQTLTANDVLVSTSTCQHTYGFLPCAENAGGYIFQILVYQGLLVFGGMQLSIGSKVFFKILEIKFHTSKYVGIIFRILMGLPSMMMMIISGIFGSKETAQSLVSLGVGIFAGVTVFTLTLQWGICLIYGANYLQNNGESADSGSREKSKLKDTGVTLHEATQPLAGIMLLSLVPYIIVQLVDIFNASRTVLLIACIVSAAFLLTYFIYQLLISDYLQYEFVTKVLMSYLEEKGKIVDDAGNLNHDRIKEVFNEANKDDDDYITDDELRKLFKKIEPGMSDGDIESAVAKTIKNFDHDNDKKINLDEFTKACEFLSKDGDFFSREFSDEIFQQFYLMRKHHKLGIHPIMSKFLVHAQSKLPEGESLIGEDGKANTEKIKDLFGQYVIDGNDEISIDELKKLIKPVKFGDLEPKLNDVVKTIVYHFHYKRDDKIDKEEFVHGIKKWLDEAVKIAKCLDKTKSVKEFDRIVWEKLVHRRTFWNFVKCVSRIVLGIVIMTFVGGPLTTSILQLSYAIGVPSFSISFVIVPLAMNTRTLIEAIFPVGEKTQKTASLIFSEIYNSVAMNNISNLTILLAVVYVKDLPWDYSAEVLTILVVCAVIGILGFSTTKYPFWTCLLAFFLYPFSLALYCFVELVLHWN
ncbi:sodium/calcium exchanger NCL-like [Olea europaea var. sylvestris]|uniref:sodium/calcium exchanger NCL-like n=1 Tax=Olea europaea var. sylvestris TaxID=158386 RepID=UPI000C1D5D81|nr:sodium/calcium exchanger NCL-like [Olea europaea var. sylvestris]